MIKFAALLTNTPLLRRTASEVYDLYFSGNIQRQTAFTGTIDPSHQVLLISMLTILIISWCWLLFIKQKLNKQNQIIIENEKKYRDIIESINEWFWEVDLTGMVTYSSPNVEHVIGYTQDEMIGKPAFDFMNEKEVDRIKKYFKDKTDCFAPLKDFICYEISKSGKTVILESSFTPVYDENGIIKGFRGVSRDVTEKQNTQDALKKSETRLRFAMEATEDGIWDWDLETGNAVANPSCYTMIGYDPDEFIMTYESWCNLIHPDDFDRCNIQIQAALNSGAPYNIEFRCKCKNGNWKWIQARGKCVAKDPSGKPIRIVGTNTDISRHKTSEAAIRKNESELNAIYENAPVLMLLLDRDRHIIKINQEALAFTKTTREKAIGVCIGELFNCINFKEDDHNKCEQQNNCKNCFLRKTIDNTLQSGKSFKNLETSFQYNSQHGKEERYFHISTKLITEFEQDTILLCMEDITDRKRYEETLKKRMYALTMPLSNPENISFEDLFNLEDIQKLQDDFSKATGVASFITTPDGTPITKPSNFCRLCSDIIRKSETGCKNCYKSDAALGILCLDGPNIQPCLSAGLWDAGAGIAVGGRHIANWLIGQVRDETQSEESMRVYARKIDVDEDEFIKAFLEVPAMSYEKFESISQALFSLAGQLSDIAYQNIQQARFISQIEITQQALQESEARLREAQRMAQMGHWYWDINTGEVEWSEEVYKIFHIEPSEFKPTIRAILELSPWPEDHNRDKELIDTASESHDLHDYEQHFLYPDGTEAYYYSTFQGIYAKNNELVAIKGTVQDITERKKAEELIKNYNEILKEEVKKRTDELVEKNSYLQDEINERKKAEQELKTATSQLVQSEKLATIGQLAAGVAHEINSPLGAIGSSNSTIIKHFKHVISDLKNGCTIVNSCGSLLNELIILISECKYELSSRENRELKKELTDFFTRNGVENPSAPATLFANIGMVKGYERFLPLLLDKNTDKIVKFLENVYSVIHGTRIIDTAVHQSSRVVNALREFAHADNSTELSYANIRETIDTAIVLYGNRIKHGVDLNLDLDEVPNTMCYPHKLSQVWTNLIQNAVQAIGQTGTLTISLKKIDNNICVKVTDTGCGISSDIIDRIFEPLFTTKAVGEGTGLGLDIAKTIIEKHNGSIDVSSIEGKGTTFTVKIPIIENSG